MNDTTRARLLLLGVLAVSAFVVARAFNPAPHTGGDNSGYLSLAHAVWTGAGYVDAFDPERLPHTKYPPVFPLVLAGLMALGARSWVSFKLVSAVATVATVALTYLWAERRLGTLGGLAVAALLALSAGVVYHSHWVLSDPLFVCLTVASILALERAGEDDAAAYWLPLGVLAAGLALFTRQAGLPLVLAIGGWLVLRKRWRPLALAAVALGLPSLAWWWRGRGGAVASYGEEFWMVNPYDPSLGTVDLFGLLPRVFSNLTAYLFTHGPAGIVGQGAQLGAWLGLLVAIAGVAGWLLTLRRGVGPVELFFPLYAGLILLWPEVWAGDRFVLPLYPLLFVYGAFALREATAPLPAPAGSVVPAVAFLLVLLPAGRSWNEESRIASACGAIVQRNAAFDCYGPRVGAFAEAATWTGAALPDGSVVLTRKPRHFYLLSGLPSRAFAFEADPDAQLDLADRLGARYVLLDQWDALATRYVGGAVSARPGAFCHVRSFGDPAAGTAQLLGVKPVAARDPTPGDADSMIDPCPDDYLRPESERRYRSSSSSAVPLLAGPGS